MQCRIWIPAIACIAVSTLAAAQEEPAAKQVAAPAADVLEGLVRLPDPASAATLSRAEIVPIELGWDGAGWSFETTFSVERDGPLSLAVLSADAAHWRTRVRTEDGELAELDRSNAAGGVSRRMQVLEDVLPGWVADRYDLAAAAGGRWTIRIDAPDAGPRARPAAGLLLASASSLRLSAHVTSFATLSDREVALAAHVEDSDPPLGGVARTGEVLVETERGSQRLALVDDGEHDDGAAGDGVFGARLPVGTSGEVRAHVRLRGVTSDGLPFARSVLLAFPVIERRTALTGAIAARVEDGERLRLALEAWPLGPPGKLHVSAEVWGTNARGQLVPVCWLSRMLVPEERGELWDLPQFLDGRWLNMARALPPLELRNVRVQDPDTHVVFDALERLPIATRELPVAVGRGPAIVTPDMLMGPVGAGAAPSPAGPRAPSGHALFPRALMLVHGYCSGGSIWPAADFKQPKLAFSDPNANRTHDQFALLLAQAGSALASFGVVGHSQGGPAALHLYTYYQSGLDRALGTGRRIQSVASPYQGTPLASLGGFACGVNNDMTPSGSAAWLAGIPSWARAEVWYWTTSNSGSACSFFTDFLLTNPEDGTVEQFRGQLPAANSMGHTTGWCHTTGMSNPANYTDHARNAQMNAQAAR